MLEFVKTVKQFKLDNPKEARNQLLRAAENHTHEVVLYLLCGYDYICHPTDEKWEVIHASFLTKDGPLEVNLPNGVVQAVRKELSPQFKVKVSNGGGAMDFYITAGSMGTNTIPGGFKRGGAGNYNLCTKALDATAHAMVEEMVNAAASEGQNTLVAQKDKDRYADTYLSNAYDALVGAFGPSLLTGWGMTPRGRPKQKKFSLSGLFRR